MYLELYKDNKKIGYLTILEDLQGGGLNGGVFFTKDKLTFYKSIPLFETIKSTQHL